MTTKEHMHIDGTISYGPECAIPYCTTEEMEREARRWIERHTIPAYQHEWDALNAEVEQLRAALKKHHWHYGTAKQCLTCDMVLGSDKNY